MKIDVTIMVSTEVRDQYGAWRAQRRSHRLVLEGISETDDVECRIDGEIVSSEIFKVALAMCELGHVRDA